MWTTWLNCRATQPAPGGAPWKEILCGKRRKRLFLKKKDSDLSLATPTSPLNIRIQNFEVHLKISPTLKSDMSMSSCDTRGQYRSLPFMWWRSCANTRHTHLTEAQNWKRKNSIFRRLFDDVWLKPLTEFVHREQSGPHTSLICTTDCPVRRRQSSLDRARVHAYWRLQIRMWRGSHQHPHKWQCSFQLSSLRRGTLRAAARPSRKTSPAGSQQ